MGLHCVKNKGAVKNVTELDAWKAGSWYAGLERVEVCELDSWHSGLAVKEVFSGVLVLSC